jgi:PAB1-binding protein PBP1
VNADNPVQLLQSASADRIKSELEELRTGLIAWSEQALDRFRDTGLVPLETVSGVIQELAAITTAERQRAASLEEALRAAKAELETAHQTTARVRQEAAVHLENELKASREAAEVASAAAIRARAQLTAVQNRSQQIVDEQALQLMEFKRELETVASEVRRARGGMETMQRVAVARLPELPAVPSMPAALAVPHVVTHEPDRRQRRSADTLQFDAIEAALADSPPVLEWPRVAV